MKFKRNDQIIAEHEGKKRKAIVTQEYGNIETIFGIRQLYQVCFLDDSTRHEVYGEYLFTMENPNNIMKSLL